MESSHVFLDQLQGNWIKLCSANQFGVGFIQCVDQGDETTNLIALLEQKLEDHRTQGWRKVAKTCCCCVIAAFSDVEVHALFILDLFLILHSKYLISTFIITSVLGKWFFDGSFLGETLPPQQHPSMCFATAYTTPSCAPALSAEEYLPRRP